MPHKPYPLEQRLWSKVQRGSPEQCWPWAGGCTRGGYGTFYYKRPDGTNAGTTAHRMVWQQVNGPIPEGMAILHRCDNPPCCNPGHLFVGTQKDNIDDMYGKNRHARGSAAMTRSSTKLTDEQVRHIRASYARGDISQCRLAKDFGISQTHVSRLLSGKYRP